VSLPPPGRTNRIAVAPNKYARGFQPGQEKPREVYRVVELREALEHVYFTEAHLVAYLVEGATRQPRVNKPGLDAFDRRLWVSVFFCDVDNPAHAFWTDETFEAARQQDLVLPSLQTAGIYYTRRGRRIVQPLAEPLDVRVVERFLRRWLKQLEVEGLAVDWNCRDWTRHFRLPNVPREVGGRSRCLDLTRMVPVQLAPLQVEEDDSPPKRQPRPPGASAPRARRGQVGPLDWTMELPEVWRPVAERIAAEVQRVETEWHSLFLAIAGALLSRKVPPEHVPALCHAISVLTGCDDRTPDRVVAARSTVERWQAGFQTTGARELRSRWPQAALALEDALARGQEAHARAVLVTPPAAAPVSEPDLAETVLRLEQAIRRAPDGLTLLQAGCGLGKTRAAERIAAERALKPYASPDAQGKRAPVDSKTSLSVDKHALAGQVVRHLEVLNTPVGWHFGPLARKHEDGTPVCCYHDVAVPLVEGGQSVLWELCKGRGLDPCEHHDTCPARLGYEGPQNPRVHVGPHALLPRLDEEAGTSGVLIIDEPPTLLETLTFSVADLELTQQVLDAFDGAYGGAMRPALDAVVEWVKTCAVVGQTTTLQAVVQLYEPFLQPEVLEQARRSSRQRRGDAVTCAVEAPLNEKGPKAPPLRWMEVQAAKKNRARAQQLGKASLVLKTLHQALASSAMIAARLEGRGKARQVHITAPNEILCEALQRQGAVIVLDANVDLWAPVYHRIVGYERPIQRFYAPDGAPIERTLLRYASATRTSWQPKGKLILAPSLRHGLRQALAWALEAPGNGLLALLTLPLVRLLLEACLAPEDASLEARWAEAQQSPDVLREARQTLTPILLQWPGEIRFGHYGATRGLDTMAEADNLITLGDPWANLDDVKHVCMYLGLADWEERYEAMCRAELEQAHGRLRTIHRTRPGRALHVGAIVPGGPGWSTGKVRVQRAETVRAQGRNDAGTSASPG
jgi:hypothetical protein